MRGISVWCRITSVDFSCSLSWLSKIFSDSRFISFVPVASDTKRGGDKTCCIMHIYKIGECRRLNREHSIARTELAQRSRVTLGAQLYPASLVLDLDISPLMPSGLLVEEVEIRPSSFTSSICHSCVHLYFTRCPPLASSFCCLLL